LQGEYARARRGEFTEEPFVFLSSASLKDRDNPRLCPDGHTNLQLITVASPQPSAWGLQMGHERGAGYQAAKDGLTRRMLATADRVVPGLSGNVVYEMRTVTAVGLAGGLAPVAVELAEGGGV
jgi:phytoene dehydrogenase-like protein